MLTNIKQECSCKIIHDVKTVSWLVDNTNVRTFDNISFTGYQREVNETHVLNIVDYLKKPGFYLPTSIICASAEEVTESTRLNIVDGQHRVEAFKKLRDTDNKKYLAIKDYEISVIILEKPSEELEVETFITINKTSRKVDTSLAYILKNKINKSSTNSEDLTVAKKEFLAVELALQINLDKESLWNNKIMLEGNPTKNSYETISLNSFVRSTRVLISNLEKCGIVKIDWKNNDELRDITEKLKDIYLNIWNEIRFRWPSLFVSENTNNTILQGSIGVSSINKYIVLQLKSLDGKCDFEYFNTLVGKWIRNINIDEDLWYKGNHFSKFSSESGFNIIAKMILDSYEG